jgi:hypothetical protein
MAKTLSIFHLILCLVLWLPSKGCFADRLWLVNGDQISGEVQELNATALIIKTAYAGLIAIERHSIRSFETDTAYNWKINQLTTNTKIDPAPNANHVLVNNQAVDISKLTLASIAVAPEWKTSGKLDTALEMENKINHKEKVNLSGELNTESKRWRHNIKSELKREQEEQRRTEDNAELHYTLDYFISEKWLIRGESFYREDNLGDHGRYTYLGAGPGYRLWGEGHDKLDFTTTYNHFWISKKNVSVQLDAWATGFDYKQYWLESKLETFSDVQIAFPDLIGVDRITNGNLGLRYLLTQRVYLSAKYEFDETTSSFGSTREESYTLGAGINF